MDARDLQAALRSTLSAHACAATAEAQQRYMKSAMPYYGLTMPTLRRVVRPVLAAHPFANADDLREGVRLLWDEAEHREERYAAIALLRLSRYHAWTSELATLPLLRHCVHTGAWWDLVDELAAHCVGAVLRAHPEAAGEVLRGWARDPDLWLRRAAILSQLRFGVDLDRGLLVDAIEGSLDDPDFFARKAIGWALRSHAQSSPDAAAWVRTYVRTHADRLSVLSRREALKHLQGQTAQG